MKPLLLCLALSLLWPRYAISAPLRPGDLAAQLREMQAEIDSKGASAVLAGLPATWYVATGQRRYSISSEPLRSLLVEAEKDSPAGRPASIRQAKDWLDQVA